MSRAQTDVLILGAGIAGLACRMALSDRRNVVCLEAAEEIGGLLRMHHRGAFSFDTSVHALSFRNPATRVLVQSLLTTGFHVFRKRNLVWQRGNVIDYPYQFHAHGLDPTVRDECVAGLPDDPPRALAPGLTFEEWLLAQFGPGFYRHFFEPYNRKLYGVSPSELEAASMVWTIPADNREAVLRGASGPTSGGWVGVECLYPRGTDGIHALPLRFAECGEGDILRGQRVVDVDLERRRVVTDQGLDLEYRTLVSTLPLPVFLGCAARCLPDEVARWATVLEARSVTVLQLAVENPAGALDAHWTYFPDHDLPFYRLTRLELISPDLAPRGAGAWLAECPGDGTTDVARVPELCERIGVVGDGKVSCVGEVHIPFAYVLFRRGHQEASQRAIEFLSRHDVHVAGRYGAWTYLNIDQTIESGLQAARAVLSTAPAS